MTKSNHVIGLSQLAPVDLAYGAVMAIVPCVNEYIVIIVILSSL